MCDFFARWNETRWKMKEHEDEKRYWEDTEQRWKMV